MERNEELRNEDARDAARETERAAELRDDDLRRADEGEDTGYTHSDSLVRDDSLVAGRGSADLADRTDRTSGDTLDDHPTTGDHIGEAAGGISGVIAGAAIGSLGGPIGTVIGGIAGAIGGWWTGRAISEAASNFSHADDHFRSDYETRVTVDETRRGARSYEAVRPAYQLGYLASRNPEYTGRSFDEIEPDLERGWASNGNVTGAEWVEMRDYARTAYVHGAAAQSSLTGDSSKSDDLTSTGTAESIGTGSTAPGSQPIGTVGTINPATLTENPNAHWGKSPAASVGAAEGLVSPDIAHGNVETVIDNGGVFAGTSDVTAAQDAEARIEANAREPRLEKEHSLGNPNMRSEIGPPSSGGNFSLEGGASSTTNDPSYRGANPQGSMTYQSNERLTESATDSAGGRRSETYDNIGERQEELTANQSDERPSYTDPVAGEGVENIGSSTDTPRGSDTLNTDPESDAARTDQVDRRETY